MRKLAILSAGILVIPIIVTAAPAPKYFVCKYVGTPGVSETLQTGQNPISVSGNAVMQPVVIGAFFNDAQGRSLVVEEDTGQPEPSCPTSTVVTPPPPTPTPTPTPVPTPNPTPLNDPTPVQSMPSTTNATTTELTINWGK